MVAGEPTYLAETLERLMAEAGTSAKALSLAASLNETYVRDIIEGKSKNPQASKLTALARALGCDPAILHSAATGKEGEFVSDAAERALLSTWRQLPQETRMEALDFIAFHLARLRGAGRAAGEV